MEELGSDTLDLLQPGREVIIDHRIYKIIEPIGSGGTGVVYKAIRDGRLYSMKVFYPSFLKRELDKKGQTAMVFAEGTTTALSLDISALVDAQAHEFESLSAIRHPHVVSVIDKGDVDLSDEERERGNLARDIASLPVLISEYIDGVDIGQAVNGLGLGASDLSTVLVELAKALHHVHHMHDYLHIDVKPSNVLVERGSLRTVLIDFALYKNLNFDQVGASEITRFECGWKLFPDLPPDDPLRQLNEEGQGSREEIRELAFPRLDLFQFGKLLSEIESANSAVFAAPERSYLATLKASLLDWNSVSEWQPEDLVPRVERLDPRRSRPFGVPELSSPRGAQRAITLPQGVNVPISTPVERLIGTRSFRRLSRIHQLSMLSLVYPAADYSRLVHSLYSFQLARRFVSHLYSTANFRLHFDEAAVRRLLIVSLLHDINHFPFLHIFQELESGLSRVNVLDLFCDGELTEDKPSIYELIEDLDISKARFRALVFPGTGAKRLRSEADQATASMLNSGVDIDKLSYLSLDAYFSGVHYGAGIELETLFRAARISPEPTQQRRMHLAYDSHAVPALENAVMSRYWNFRNLYWHHTNRAVMAMIMHVARKLYAEKEDGITSYIEATRWHGDIEALRFLDSQHTADLEAPSILHELEIDRSRLYKRLFTTQPDREDIEDEDLYESLRDLGPEAREGFCALVAEHLPSVLPAGTNLGALRADEVLLDVPGRGVDSGGKVYVEHADGQMSQLSSLSQPVNHLARNYDELAKRARVFVSPRVAAHLSSDWRIRERPAIEELLRDVVGRVEQGSDVR